MKKALSILLAALILLPATCLPVFADDAPAFSTYDEMVAYVRQALTARDANIRFRFDGSGFQPPAISDLCADSADGKAGDYLRLSFDGGFPQTTKDADGVYTVAARFFTDAAQEAQVDAFVRGAADACEAQTPREKARYIYDLLCSEVAFDLENLYDEAVTSKYTAWGAAVEGKAVCQGFAQLYYRLAKALELPCRIVTGTRAGENHAWNIVEVDGYWYHVDAASGAQLVDPSGCFLSPGFDGYSIAFGDYTDSAIMGYTFAPEDAENRFASGALSYLVSWTLDKTTGLLYIDGSGDTGDFTYDPPFDDLDLIRTAVVSEGITRLGSRLFANSRNLETVSIPASVSEVGSCVFEGCSSLSSITVDDGNQLYHDAGNCLIETKTKTLVAGCGVSVIPADGSVTKIADRAFYQRHELTAPGIPDGVTEIGSEAFSGCSAMTEIAFPDSLVKIGTNAFAFCTGFTNLSIPAGVTEIGKNAFLGCTGLTSITVDPANPVYRGAGNCLIETDSGKLLLGCGTSVIPSDGTVRTIAPNAFENRGTLTSVTIPVGVQTIGKEAFRGCRGLERVSIPESVTEIGSRAFEGCWRLSEITIPNGVQTIGDRAFAECVMMTKSPIPDSVIRVGFEAFEISGVLKTAHTSDGVVYIGKVAYACEDTMPAGTVLTLEPGTKAIADHVFENQRELTAVTLPESLITIGDYAFYGCSALASAPIPANVTEIGDSAFMYCDALTSAVIPAGVTVIEHGVFGDCYHLETLTLPDGLKVIGGEAFRECGALTALTIPETVEHIDLFAFYQCASLPRLTIPDSVTAIGGNAFCDCTGLTSVTIGKGLAQVGYGAFGGTESLKEITVDSANPVYHSDGNCLIETASGTLVRGCRGSVIPWDGSVTRLDYRAFLLNFEYIPVLSIPDSVTELVNNYPTSGETGNFPVNDYTPFFDHAETICGVPGSFAEALAQEVGVPFIPACPVAHAPHSSVAIDAAGATCTEPAYTAGQRCADCGEWLSGHEPVGEPLGHTGADPVRENVTDPTCTAEGAYDAVIYCARCGEKLSSTRERIAAVPHADRDENGFCDDCGADICEHSRTRERVGEAPATCTANGYSGDTVCLICGRTLLYGATIPAAGHAPVMTVTAVSPTCISAGRTAGYACAVCGEITTASRVLPVSGHTDDDADGWCDVCFSPEDCTRYGVCGDAMYWFVANETLTLSGAGDSYTFSGNAPWDAYRDDFDCVYLRTGVRTVDGTAFGAANRVFAPAGASVTDCPVPALVYTDDHGTVSLTQTDGVCAMQVYDVLNAAYVLCMDREVRALRFDEIALESTEDDFTYDILMNGKLVDERHFTVPAGTVVRDFTVKTAGYASFNDAMAALGSHPDRNLILSVRCDDLLLASMRTDPDSYTVQIVVRFVDEPDAPVPDEEPEQKGFLGSFIDRFKATLAAILALFRKLFKLFTGK